MKVFIKWLVLSIAVVALTACGGGGGSTEDPVINDGVNNNSSIEYLKTFSYDSMNRVTKEDLGNGQYIEYIYDDSGNLLSQTVVK